MCQILGTPRSRIISEGIVLFFIYCKKRLVLNKVDVKYSTKYCGVLQWSINEYTLHSIIIIFCNHC